MSEWRPLWKGQLSKAFNSIENDLQKLVNEHENEKNQMFDIDRMMEIILCRIGHNHFGLSPGTPLNYVLTFAYTMEATQLQLNKYEWLKKKTIFENDFNSGKILSLNSCQERDIDVTAVALNAELFFKSLVFFIPLYRCKQDAVIFATKKTENITHLFHLCRQDDTSVLIADVFKMYAQHLDTDTFFPVTVSQFKGMKCGLAALIMLHSAYYVFNLIPSNQNCFPLLEYHLFNSHNGCLSGVNITGMMNNEPDSIIKHASFMAPTQTISSQLKNGQLVDNLKNPLSQMITELPTPFGCKSFDVLISNANDHFTKKCSKQTSKSVSSTNNTEWKKKIDLSKIEHPFLHRLVMNKIQSIRRLRNNELQNIDLSLLYIDCIFLNLGLQAGERLEIIFKKTPFSPSTRFTVQLRESVFSENVIENCSDLYKLLYA